MLITFKINEDKAVGYSMRFNETDKINGKQGLILVAQYIIESLGKN